MTNNKGCLTADTVLAHAADVKQDENATAPPFTHT
jgi:hypothetical protein